MDWYFDVVILIGTFCVIAIGMTIYARLSPTRPRVGRSHYIFTGIIPTITISSPDHSPTKQSPKILTPADSTEEDECLSNNSESPVDDAERELQLKYSQNMRLSVPDLDDDDEEEEEQQSDQSEDMCVPVSLSLVDIVKNSEDKDNSQTKGLSTSPPYEKAEGEQQSASADKENSQIKGLTMSSPREKGKKDENDQQSTSADKDNSQMQDLTMSSPWEKAEKDECAQQSTPTDKDNSQTINSITSSPFENVDVHKQKSMSALLFDKSDDEDLSQTTSLSATDDVDDEQYLQTWGSSEPLPTLDDASSSPNINESDNSSETHETPYSTVKNSISSNKSLRTIGTSHTVEEPLFPFSEIVEEQHPSALKRFKKRFSQ